MSRLESDTYAIQRVLAGTKELRFKQIAAADGLLYGLTEDGEVYWWTADEETERWELMPMIGGRETPQSPSSL
jgi:hypothetical protein